MITVTVPNHTGVIYCHGCRRKMSYDLRGLPPGVSQRATCQCGESAQVKRVPLAASLGPSEVKRANP